MNKYHDLYEEQKNVLFQNFLTVLKFPSVSADKAFHPQVHACADWLCDYMKDLGAKVEQITQYGLPVILADFFVDKSLPTVLFYGHYDVQPANDRELWFQDPFDPLFRDGKIFGRGVADDKGPIMMGLFAISLLKHFGKLPVNIKFVLEGEEESSGKALFDFVERESEKIKSDLVLCTDTGGFRTGRAAITYSTRGLVYKQIDLVGPSHDLHSGAYGGPVMPPTNALALILAGLFDAQGRINIPGVYDKVRPIDPDERKAYAQLEFDVERYKKHVGSNTLVCEPGFTPLEQNWCRPNLCVNGIVGGYTGQGPKTVLPSVASAKISMRLVPDQNPDEISQLLEKRIRELCPPGIRLEIKDFGRAEPFMGLRSGPAADAASEAIRTVYNAGPDLIREGGTIPILSHFAKYVNPNVLCLGFTGSECNTHGPNENLSLDAFDKGVETTCLFFELLAGRLRHS
jgi:succinyl-diaminopimelate desuccinylase